MMRSVFLLSVAYWGNRPVAVTAIGRSGIAEGPLASFSAHLGFC